MMQAGSIIPSIPQLVRIDGQLIKLGENTGEGGTES